ncbi:hypothetical protein BDR04DRAFT_505245 [Suillus decipiens]|nr:hypothetical protein BDR04DRAFT_505245 [Suillus decipiens]
MHLTDVTMPAIMHASFLSSLDQGSKQSNQCCCNLGFMIRGSTECSSVQWSSGYDFCLTHRRS